MSDDRVLGHPSVALIERLTWNTGRSDIVAAGRFATYPMTPGARVEAFDVYLLTDGTVEVWEDVRPDDPDHDGPVIHAHRDWHAILTPMFKAALERSLERGR